jgi:hypothetical protein
MRLGLYGTVVSREKELSLIPMTNMPRSRLEFNGVSIQNLHFLFLSFNFLWNNTGTNSLSNPISKLKLTKETRIRHSDALKRQKPARKNNGSHHKHYWLSRPKHTRRKRPLPRSRTALQTLPEQSTTNRSTLSWNVE